ncbi:P-loop NTPase family protein [Leptolyngbya sp. NIES-2104]|uniref:P-loop NTPase family protein n=1 Tax=Leptolyngbya sp. NIES-2104 TaxID=1552121 RepID=UPI0006ECA1AA|nr:P-loop NTPase family protein [Leptolyngbya sp. NIES-2104]GAP98187.1 cob(I)alamin adenosyltransferase [Leptolyngbya sp. NIES-2104]
MVSQVETPVFDASRSRNLSVEGLVQVFTTFHRSFFTGVLAQAMRIAGQGTPVLVVQFLKGGIGQGYDRPMQLSQNLDWIRCNVNRCIDSPQISEEEARSLLDLWQHTRRVVEQNRYDLVVLDELSLAIHFGLIPEAEVLDFLRSRPRHVDVILTGPNMPEAILDVADQITELRRTHQP